MKVARSLRGRSQRFLQVNRWDLLPISIRLKSTVQIPSPIERTDKDGYVEAKEVELKEKEITGCPVNSHNEFDPLREVIVGCVGDATVPEWHVSGKAVWPSKHWDFFKKHSGSSFPTELMSKAAEELDGFARILEAEGVTVRRPGKYYNSPFFPHTFTRKHSHL